MNSGLNSSQVESIQPNISQHVSYRKRRSEIINTCNSSVLEQGAPLDRVSKFLLITRSCVLSMTVTSGFIGLMLALLTSSTINWFHFTLALIGIVLAHMSNNMTNDFFDLEGGVDDSEYVRALYAPHPILSGLVTKKQLLSYIFIVNLLDLSILLYFVYRLGPFVLLFGLSGFFISLFYVAPPVKLKHIGLGELGVFLIWGPLMIGGTYYVTTGMITSGILLATIPYGITVTTVLVGKHIDKLETDKAKGIHTLPVLLGRKASLYLNQALMISFYVIILVLVAFKVLGIGILISFFALKRLIEVLKIYNQPKPEQPPENYPVWPLWYVSWAFYHNKLAGGLFILGLLLNLVLNQFSIVLY